MDLWIVFDVRHVVCFSVRVPVRMPCRMLPDDRLRVKDALNRAGDVDQRAGNIQRVEDQNMLYQVMGQELGKICRPVNFRHAICSAAACLDVSRL